MMQDTKWRYLPEFPGYIVSDDGQIAKLISPQPNIKGYLRVFIMKNGRRCTRYLHRLIASVWVENPMNKLTVNHINKNNQDNRVENLEWMTNEENVAHGWLNNTKFGDHKGVKNGRSKLSNEDVINIRRRFNLGESNKEISQSYSVGHDIIWGITSGRSWKHLN